MRQQPFSDFAVPRQVPAGVMPKYAFDRALDIINGLTDNYTKMATALAEARPDHADEIAAHLAEVLDSVHAGLGEALAPPR